MNWLNSHSGLTPCFHFFENNGARLAQRLGANNGNSKRTRMNSKVWKNLFGAAVSLSVGLSACGVSEAEDAADTNTDVTAANDAIVTAVGFLIEGGRPLHIKSGVPGNICGQSYDAVLSTNTCSSTEPNQQFSITQMEDGKYNLCKGGSIKYNANETVCTEFKYDPTAEYGGEICTKTISTITYRASCLDTVGISSKDYRFYDTLLSWYNPATKKFVASPGKIVKQGDFYKMYTKYLTRNSGNVVVPASYTGAANQKWTFY